MKKLRHCHPMDTSLQGKTINHSGDTDITGATCWRLMDKQQTYTALL